MIWLTANQNFGRHGSIELWQRPFKDVTDMNATLIKNWNKTVGKDDIVWVLGDFVWDPETAEEVVKKLNGKIQLLKGFYDLPMLNFLKKDDIFVNGLHWEKINDLVHTFSYWPQCEWYGEYSFIGYPNWEKYPTDFETGRINVCCDLWDFKPVSIDKIIDLIESVKKDTKN